MKPWTENELHSIRQQWRARHARPVSIRELSQKYGRHRRLLTRVLLDPNYNPCKPSKEDRTLIIRREYFLNGLTQSAIAKKYNWTKKTVEYAIYMRKDLGYGFSVDPAEYAKAWDREAGPLYQLRRVYESARP